MYACLCVCACDCVSASGVSVCVYFAQPASKVNTPHVPIKNDEDSADCYFASGSVCVCVSVCGVCSRVYVGLRFCVSHAGQVLCVGAGACVSMSCVC